MLVIIAHVHFFTFLVALVHTAISEPMIIY